MDGSAKDIEQDITDPLLKQSARPADNGEVVSFTGIIQHNVSNLESLDYEIIENDVFKQDWRARNSYEVLQYVIMKWTFAFLIGVLTGLTALAINMAVENIAGSRFLITTRLIHSDRFWLGFAVFILIGVVLVLFASLLCVYFGPAAAGSGIPEVKAYLNGIDAPEILTPNTLVVKVLGSIGAVAAGLCVGKEGPLVHVGACIAALLGQGGSKKYNLDWKWLRVFKNDRDRRDLVTCGAAAGVAAAFKAPVGGVLFALEEASSWWRSSLLWRTFFTTAVVAVVLRIGGLLCKRGKCGLFGSGGLILFDVSDVFVNFSILDLLPTVILGISGGLFGSVFNKMNCAMSAFYARFNKRDRGAKVVVACIVGLITGLVYFIIPWFGSCRPCPEAAVLANQCPSSGVSGNFKKFNCVDGHYNDLASLFFTTNDDAIRNLFSTGTSQEYHYTSVLIFLTSTYLMTLMTYGIAVPSGLFIPVILNGASFGRIVGMLMSSSRNLKLDEGLYAVLGAAAFLGGSMRMTVSLCVILLELTNNLTMLPLIMMVLLIAKTVGDLFNKALYELHVMLKGFPVLEGHSEPFMHHLTARDAVKAPLVKLSRVEKVGVIMDVLTRTKHNAFPVIDFTYAPGKAVFCGLVLRSHLLVLLKNKEFQPSSETGNGDVLARFSALDFAKAGSGKGIQVDDIEVNMDEEQKYIDLYPITNASPYTVLETMSLAKAYMLFRQLGLRHLCVMPKTPQDDPIVGILTRHDFVPENLLAMYPYLKRRTPKVPRLASFLPR